MLGFKVSVSGRYPNGAWVQREIAVVAVGDHEAMVAAERWLEATYTNAKVKVVEVVERLDAGIIAVREDAHVPAVWYVPAKWAGV